MKLSGRRKAILNCLNNGGRWTVDELQWAIGGKHTSISADLRNLRKAKYGAHNIKSSPRMAEPFYYWIAA